MLYGVPALMGCHCSRCYAVAVIDIFAEIDRIVLRIVVVCQLALNTGYLHFRNTVIREHTAGDIISGTAGRCTQLGVFLKLSVQIVLNSKAQYSYYNEQDPVID